MREWANVEKFYRNVVSLNRFSVKSPPNAWAVKPELNYGVRV
jgi:hypothetical protein